MTDLPSACVIGAGSSGIAAAKALHERGVPFDCFELSDRVGGNWVFENTNRLSSAYRSLHINTSRERMEYADFPMPSDYPDFPHRTHIAKYFDDYVDHFGLRERITFGTGVEQADRRGDGVWEVKLTTGEERLYDALLVANGHHRDPRWPEPPFPGEFSGEQMHSHYYIDNAPLRGKAVLVIGIGNSAMDIAAYLRGEDHLPPISEMEELTRRERAKMLRRYVASKRHTMQVDFDDYLHDLRRELRAGARRARARGFRLPVPARAAQPAVLPIRA